MIELIYPVDWPEISYIVRSYNNWRCLACDKCCRRPGEMFLGWEYELSVAHICQDYEAEAVYVAALCLPCHLRYDAPHSWIARHRRARIRQRVAGQLSLI